MDYRPCPELCGGYAAMRIPTATAAGRWATSAPTARLNLRTVGGSGFLPAGRSLRRACLARLHYMAGCRIL